jgi:superfamily II DNA or RNA helicase
MTKIKYPSIKDDDFYNKVNKIYKKYTIPKDKKSLRQICFPEKYELQLPQQFISQFINPDTPYKGILVYHRIGAGKTCTAIRVGEEWKHKKNIIVVLPASLKGNFRNELRSQCADDEYLTKKEREMLKKLHPSEEAYQEIMDESDERINKYYTIYSYNKFIELLENKKINFKNTLLMIDEIQNMVSEEGKYYQVLYDAIQKAPSDMRIVLLSATPMFDKPSEIALTLNLLRLPTELPVGNAFDRKFITYHQTNGKPIMKVKNLDYFKDAIKGYVSYFRGAPPHVFPKMTLKYVECEMSDFQLSVYKSILKNEEVQIGKISMLKELPNNFYIGTRFASNVVFPNKKVGEEGLKSFKGKYIKKDLETYSPKFAKIIDKIEHRSGKAFVYSGFKEFGGIRSFINVLEEFGYKNYLEHGEGKKRYAIWSGDESVETKEEIKAVYNQKSNLNGSKIKVLLGSPSIKEGVSLAGVRQVHLIDPYWNKSRIDQVIGRASRFCSHKDLEEEKRTVKVYIYIATHKSIPQTVDQYIAQVAAKKNKIIMEFERSIKEAAVDCSLFKNGNVFKGEDDLICVK